MTDDPCINAAPIQSVAAVIEMSPEEREQFDNGERAVVVLQSLPIVAVDFYNATPPRDSGGN